MWLFHSRVIRLNDTVSGVITTQKTAGNGPLGIAVVFNQECLCPLSMYPKKVNTLEDRAPRGLMYVVTSSNRNWQLSHRVLPFKGPPQAPHTSNRNQVLGLRSSVSFCLGEVASHSVSS